MQMDSSIDIPGTQTAPKRAFFGHFWHILKPRSAHFTTHSCPPPLSSWLILYVIVPHTHRYHSPKFWPNPQHHGGIVIFAHFAHAYLLLLLAAC